MQVECFMYSDLESLPPMGVLESRTVMKHLVRTISRLSSLNMLLRFEPVIGLAVRLSAAFEQLAKSGHVNREHALIEVHRYLSNNIDNMLYMHKYIEKYEYMWRIAEILITRTGVLRLDHLIEIRRAMEGEGVLIRRSAGETWLSHGTDAVTAKPPYDWRMIASMMEQMFRFFNDENATDVHDLVKAAMIHYQLESIQPFESENQQTAVFVDQLFIFRRGLLSQPVLPLSFFLQRKLSLCRETMLRVRHDDAWEAWFLFFLGIVEDAAGEMEHLLLQAGEAYSRYGDTMLAETRFYSRSLLDELFTPPWTSIDKVMQRLDVTRLTAVKYLETLVDLDLLIKHKHGRMNYFFNTALLNGMMRFGRYRIR
jgi:hypothetical protein